MKKLSCGWPWKPRKSTYESVRGKHSNDRGARSREYTNHFPPCEGNIVSVELKSPSHYLKRSVGRQMYTAVRDLTLCTVPYSVGDLFEGILLSMKAINRTVGIIAENAILTVNDLLSVCIVSKGSASS